jgi:glycosyltransferase involved in cell wall biosynthesis
MLKIAYILDFFPVLSETFIVREILELRRKGFEVVIFARGSVENWEYSEVIHDDSQNLMQNVVYLKSLLKKRSKLQLARCHLYFLLRHPFRYLKTFSFVCGRSNKVFARFKGSALYAIAIKKMQVSHIHAHFALDACTIAMLISMLTGVSYSFTAHAHDIFAPKLAELTEEKFNYARFAVCISDYNKQYILQNYPKVKPDNIKIIHCGIGLDIFTHNLLPKNEKLTILSIGRLVDQKGFKYLIQACNLLRKRTDLNFICKIIGEGKKRQELEELIFQYDLREVVTLLGALKQSDVLRTFTYADIFVLPCVVDRTTGYKDGIPVVLMEAMATGIPVISTRVSGIPELVKDGCGILVEPEDANGLAMAIESICLLPVEERKNMGRAGRAIVETEFSLEKEVQKLAESFVA